MTQQHLTDIDRANLYFSRLAKKILRSTYEIPLKRLPEETRKSITEAVRNGQRLTIGDIYFEPSLNPEAEVNERGTIIVEGIHFNPRRDHIPPSILDAFYKERMNEGAERLLRREKTPMIEENGFGTKIASGKYGNFEKVRRAEMI